MSSDYKQPSLTPSEPTPAARRGKPAKFWWALAIGGVEFAYPFFTTGFGLKSLAEGIFGGLLWFAVVGLVLAVLDWARHRVM